MLITLVIAGPRLASVCTSWYYLRSGLTERPAMQLNDQRQLLIVATLGSGAPHAHGPTPGWLDSSR